MTRAVRKAWRLLEGESLSRGDRALEAWPMALRALEIVRSYVPLDAQQASTRARFEDFIQAHPEDAHLRALSVGHLTASGLVVDPERGQALLTHHKKLGRWLQLGGHADGDANLVAVALREACEESGLLDLRVLPAPIDLDVHLIPARPGETAHWHWDARFLILAPAGSVEAASEESHALAWISPEQVVTLTHDESVLRLYRTVFE